ncbi:MAG TPA: FAD-binding oxidoreductase [Bacillus bacterium]|uniref:Oxidoreductase n=1 Tax=Siminovitchia fordii TaxID=254759 RepID=A0ABQ4K9G3_9BACI|nr:FAD-binding oxidoreductase [Siminovitchia fordii]GIN22359.1 oxidoreductase [Siminovitchia fordii]HBZ11860.1 FAD-binding oxidoreductase [Bacillus sp. (in: firmicutes)]
MDSLSMWEATAGERKSRPTLQGEQHCDIVIIGGGFSGLSTSYHLQKMGYRTIVLEKNTVGYGASGRNGGELLTGYHGTMESFAQKKGFETAKKMWELSLDSIDLVENITKENGISCDLVRKGDIRPAYKVSHLEKFKRDQEYLAEKFNFHEISIIDRSEMKTELNTDFYHGARINERGAHFHPLKFVLGLADVVEGLGGSIFENSEAVKVKRDSADKVTVTTPNGRVIADEVVIVTNAYAGNLDNTLKKSVIPVESIMIATEPLTEELIQELIPKNRAVSDSKNLLYYFRRTGDNRMAFGGSGRALGKRAQRKLFDNLREGMTTVFPQLKDARVEYRWGGKVGFTQDFLPYIGQLEDGTYFAFGYCGKGAAMAVMAGKVLAETIHHPDQVNNPLKKESLRPIPFHSQHAKGVGLMKFYMAFQDKYGK